MPVYLSDRGFLASRGLSYTFPGTTTTLDAAFPITHNLGAVPSALELWVEQSAGVWEKHDPSTYVQASSTQLVSTGTTLVSVLGAGVNVRLVATTGGVAVSVQEATASVPGIVSTTTQTFAGDKSFLNQVGIGTASPATTVRLHTYVGPTENYRGFAVSSGDTDTTTGFGVQFSVDNTNGIIFLNAHTSGNGSNLKQFAIRTGNGAESGAARTPLTIDTATGSVTLGPSGFTGVHTHNGASLFQTPSGTTTIALFRENNANIPVFSIESTTDGMKIRSSFNTGIPGKFEIQADGGSSSISFRTNNAERGSITNTGAWTLGTSGFTGTHVVNGALQVTTRNASSSNVAAFFTSTGILSTVSSSQRYKTNITSLGEASSLVLGLRPVEFDYIAEESPSRKLVGLIAEEVEQVIPNMVVRDESGQPDSVFYQDLPIYLLKAIQELAALRSDDASRIAELAAKLDAAQAEIDALKSRQS